MVLQKESTLQWLGVDSAQFYTTGVLEGSATLISHFRVSSFVMN